MDHAEDQRVRELFVGRRVAEEVARLDQEEHDRDRANRRKHYDALGRSADATVA